MKRFLNGLGIAGALCLGAAPASAASPQDYFGIEVLDEQTGRGVPLVELLTVNHVVHVTDSAGSIAFNEPGLMDRKVFFHVRSHGYEFPKDGFGFAGQALDVKRGGSVTLKLKRLNLAERLYRITGQGIYRDSVLLGMKPPLAEPVLNAEVLGQDSIQPVRYRDKLHWFWGDTQRARYPLGQFHMSGAVSDLPGKGGLAPSVGINLKYFTDAEGFSKRMAPFPEPGLVWIEGVFVVPDETGRERLVGHFSRRKDLAEEYEHGLVVFDDERAHFERLQPCEQSNRWRHPQGHIVRQREGGVEYLLFSTPLCTVRVPATLAAVRDPAKYEAFTCLTPGGNFWGGESALERDSNGKLVWGWKRDTTPVGQAEELAFVRAGKIKPAEARFNVTNADTGKPVTLHAGSVNWNPFRNQWVMIAVEQGGTSFLGEVWYAEAPSPTGPWRRAKKIVTHDKYSFYNPRHHAFFDEEGGRFIYFEGTYTREFSGNPVPTPRYDYNQIMYRLDLADPRLRLSPDAAR